jgi:hypothetical protein
MRNEKLPALAEALPGMRFGPEHAHTAASQLRSFDLQDAELRDLQERVTAHLAAIPGSWGVDSDGDDPASRRQQRQDAAERRIWTSAVICPFADPGEQNSQYGGPVAVGGWELIPCRAEPRRGRARFIF